MHFPQQPLQQSIEEFIQKVTLNVIWKTEQRINVDGTVQDWTGPTLFCGILSE